MRVDEAERTQLWPAPSGDTPPPERRLSLVHALPGPSVRAPTLDRTKSEKSVYCRFPETKTSNFTFVEFNLELLNI